MLLSVVHACMMHLPEHQHVHPVSAACWRLDVAVDLQYAQLH